MVFRYFYAGIIRGELDPDGKIWGVPYRCGCLVIAYKKNKFVKKGLAPIKASNF